MWVATINFFLPIEGCEKACPQHDCEERVWKISQLFSTQNLDLCKVANGEMQRAVI
jgi:hypothetical protein